MADNSSDPAIPANIRDAFDQAVNELIAWDRSGEEPTVNIDGKPTPISTIAHLAETYKDTIRRVYSGAWSITPIALANATRRRWN
jgi:hypothetical protein